MWSAWYQCHGSEENSREKPGKTLVGLSGVDTSIWEKFVGYEREYKYTNDLVEDVIKNYGHFPSNYHDLDFVYFHVTTSADKCAAIKKFEIILMPVY